MASDYSSTYFQVPSYEEFKTIFKYLAFVACAGKAPITQKLLDESLIRIKKAGELENIARWCSWTPTQLSLLELATKLEKVVITGGNGTGKTVVLDAFAVKTAKNYPELTVIFAIFQSQKYANSLLQLQLEAKYESLNLENISVKTFNNLYELNNFDLHNTVICIDELGVGGRFFPNSIEDLNKINSKSIWLVLRDTKDYDFVNKTLEEYMKNQLSDWTIVNLSYPLRTSKELSEKVRSGEINFYYHTNCFNEKLQTDLNMPSGPHPLILEKNEGSYLTRFQHSFETVGKEKPALIIYAGLIPTSEEKEKALENARKTTSLQPMVEYIDANKEDKEFHEEILVAIDAVTCNRPDKPLLWFYSFVDLDCVNDKEAIKCWFKGEKRFARRDLITDIDCCAGIESDFVIYLGDYSEGAAAAMSRCKGQFVQIK